MSDQLRMSLQYGKASEFHVTYGREVFILFYEIPVSTIELPKRRFQTSPDISLPEKLIGKSHRPKMKHFDEEQALAVV